MIPKSHPRYKSLMTRKLIVEGVQKGITSLDGLVAQGRGETFDYLQGEKTNNHAISAIKAAASMLLLAKHPVISVNGNSAALCARELAALSRAANAKLEVNIFHSSRPREERIKNHLIANGARKVLLPSRKCRIKFLESNRKFVNPDGIFASDVVFVPLEDGDRAEALIKNGKKIITIDLNPMSRTARKSTITIVDNIVRAVPLITEEVSKMKKHSREKLEKILKNYNNKKNLETALKNMLKNLP